MENVPFASPQAEVPAAGRSWSLFSWTPTSVTLAQAAENKLLSRFQFFRPESTKAGAAPADKAKTENESQVSSGAAGDATAKTNEADEQLLARVGLVDIGGGRMVNTLVIDRMDPAGWGATPKVGILRKEVVHGSGGDIVRLEQDVAPVEEVGKCWKKKKTLVMTHGYGAGLGFFYRNFAGLSEVLGWRIYAIDWLGMANSSRPTFPPVKRGATDDEMVDQAESFFVDSLEDWRKANNIEKMSLLGHSLGGYFSACYALKHPDRVEKLILVSPAGIGKKPVEQHALNGRRGFLVSVFVRLWQLNVTPMQIIRTMGHGVHPSSRNTPPEGSTIWMNQIHRIYRITFIIFPHSLEAANTH